MSKKTQLLLCCIIAFLAASTVHADNLNPKNFDHLVAGPGTCNIPAPTNFQVVETGTTYAKLKWDYCSNATGGYRIRMYRTSDNTLLETKYRGQDQLDVTFDQLPNNTGLTAIINARCDTEDSPNEVSAPAHTLILELVVIGFTPTSGTVTCSLPENHVCSFSAEGQNFRITGPGLKPMMFNMSVNMSTSKFRCNLNSNDPNQGFYFVCSAPNGSANCESNNIKVWGLINNVMTTVAEFSVNGTQVGPNLYGIYFYPGVNIEKIGGGGQFGSPGGNYSIGIGSNPVNNLAAVSPNPFTQSLDLHFNSDYEAAQVQLFDLSGKKVLEHHFFNLESESSISTADIAPGFYFLKVQSGDQIQTLKVVKAE